MEKNIGKIGNIGALEPLRMRTNKLPAIAGYSVVKLNKEKAEKFNMNPL